MHGLTENKDMGAKRGNEGFCLLCAGGDRFRSVKAAKVLQQATQVEPCADTLHCAAARCGSPRWFSLTLSVTQTLPKHAKGWQVVLHEVETTFCLSWPLSWDVEAQRRWQNCRQRQDQEMSQQDALPDGFHSWWLWHTLGASVSFSAGLWDRILPSQRLQGVF